MEARERFEETLGREVIPLDEAALWIAAEHDASVDVEACLSQLDELAHAAEDWVGDASLEDDPVVLIRRYHDWFFGEAGFVGNTEDYYDVRNSFLHQVLERRTGIPITLTAVYSEIARRLGWPVAGVGFPGHFLARWELAHHTVIVDVFGRRTLSREACEQLLARVTGGRGTFSDELLSATSHEAILVRMLNNLRAIWVRSGDLVSAIAACDRILLVAPEHPVIIRDRGLLWLKLECYRPAARDLERYVELAPRAEDRPAIQAQLDEARQMAGRIS